MWPQSAKQIFEILTETQCVHSAFESIKIQGVATDSRTAQPNEMFVAIKGEKFDGHDYLKDCFEKNKIAIALVCQTSKQFQTLDAEHKKRCIAVADVTLAFRKLAHFFRSQFSFPVLAIGGSNGKTTTKEMLYSMLIGHDKNVTKTEKSENGFLGMAVTLTQKKHNQSNPPHALVLEIGIDDIGAMAQHVALAQPEIALLTALGPEHLEGLKTWEIAAAEELILFSYPTTTRVWQLSDEKILLHFLRTAHDDPDSLKKDFAVVPKDLYEKKTALQDLKKTNAVKHICIWEIQNATAQETKIQIDKETYHIPLPGEHNACNFALAFATALANKESKESIQAGFSKFIPPDMRSNIVTLKNQTVLYNDAYNASPMSVKSALTALENKDWRHRPKIVVLGDMLDLGEESKHWHTELFYTLKNLKHTHLCLYGQAMYDCYKLLKENEDRLNENQTRVFWLSAAEHPELFFQQLPTDFSPFVILVKGSRGMKLERFIHVVQEKCK